VPVSVTNWDRMVARTPVQEPGEQAAVPAIEMPEGLVDIPEVPAIEVPAIGPLPGVVKSRSRSW